MRISTTDLCVSPGQTPKAKIGAKRAGGFIAFGRTPSTWAARRHIASLVPLQAGRGAGAAILSASDDSDVALVIANADATAAAINKANPFLQHFTVDDLKAWADRNMRGPNLRLSDVLAAKARRLPVGHRDFGQASG